MDREALNKYFEQNHKGGFRRISEPETKFDPCPYPEHNPPTHIVLQPGTWEWTCPHCGAKTNVHVNKITC